MKFVSIVFSLLAVTCSNSTFASVPSASGKALEIEAEAAIYDFFISSSRKVQKVEIESYSKLGSPALDYLVEAQVRAQSPIGTQMIDYHCGVFVKKLSYSRWLTKQTVCEALPENSVKFDF